ncbi:MAG: amidohydrolase [Acidimicrobiales bacterium]|nr:MAG: amidohydrolase [Acidimicrobiales bacterium]
MGETTFPTGTVDTHMHFYDQRFPSAPAAVLRPPDATVADYTELQRELGLQRVVVVQPTTYGMDNTCQLEAMASFGDDSRGVMVVDASVTDDELARLTALGVRGARFHLLPGGAVPAEMLVPTAERIAEYGWHIQLQTNGRDLTDHLARLQALPCDLVVDHVGRFMPPVPETDASFAALRTLMAGGRCWVKLSAPYESSVTGPPAYRDVADLARVLVEDAPERMLWASNWPHPGQEDPPSPDVLAELIADWVGSAAVLQQILVDNPTAFYGFES